MPKPTATELIERIDALLCYRDQVDITFSSTHYPKVNLLESLQGLRAHLSDPWISVEELGERGDEVLATDGVVIRLLSRQEVKAAAATNPVKWSPLPPLPQKAGEA